jgi:hypothetical protein
VAERVDERPAEGVARRRPAAVVILRIFPPRLDELCALAVFAASPVPAYR